MPARHLCATHCQQPRQERWALLARRPSNDPSPAGEFIAEATARVIALAAGGRLITATISRFSQTGRAAPGGELEYVVKGKMIGGFALVAYPAEYRNSGVMTFIVNHNGIVYEKDLDRAPPASPSE